MPRRTERPAWLEQHVDKPGEPEEPRDEQIDPERRATPRAVGEAELALDVVGHHAVLRVRTRGIDPAPPALVERALHLLRRVPGVDRDARDGPLASFETRISPMRESTSHAPSALLTARLIAVASVFVGSRDASAGAASDRHSSAASTAPIDLPRDGITVRERTAGTSPRATRRKSWLRVSGVGERVALGVHAPGSTSSAC